MLPVSTRPGRRRVGLRADIKAPETKSQSTGARNVAACVRKSLVAAAAGTRNCISARWYTGLLVAAPRGNKGVAFGRAEGALEGTKKGTQNANQATHAARTKDSGRRTTTKTKNLSCEMGGEQVALLCEGGGLAHAMARTKKHARYSPQVN